MRFVLKKGHHLCALPGEKGTIYALYMGKRAHFLRFTWKKGHNLCALCGKRAQFVRFALEKGHNLCALPGKKGIIYRKGKKNFFDVGKC